MLPGFSHPHLQEWLLCGMSGGLPRPSLASVLCRSLRDDCAGASPSVVGTRAHFKITLGRSAPGLASSVADHAWSGSHRPAGFGSVERGCSLAAPADLD